MGAFLPFVSWHCSNGQIPPGLVQAASIAVYAEVLFEQLKGLQHTRASSPYQQTCRRGWTPSRDRLLGRLAGGPLAESWSLGSLIWHHPNITTSRIPLYFELVRNSVLACIFSVHAQSLVGTSGWIRQALVRAIWCPRSRVPSSRIKNYLHCFSHVESNWNFVMVVLRLMVIFVFLFTKNNILLK